MKFDCKKCGKQFELSDHELEHYKKNALPLPETCSSCRSAAKSGSKRPLWLSLLILAVIVAAAFFFGGNKGDDSTHTGESSVSASAAQSGSIAPAADGTDIPTACGETEDRPQAPPQEASTTEALTEDAPTAEAFTEEALAEDGPPADVQQLRFRSEKYLDQHWDKHGEEFAELGYKDKYDYLAGANRVINDPDALTKTEREDGDYIFYLEKSNEFVVVSTDGYIRTYFRPNAGIDYFNRQ